MQIFRNLAVLLFCLFVASEVYGQTPAMSQLPWWDYRPERIDNDFTSIIGASGPISFPTRQESRGVPPRTTSSWHFHFPSVSCGQTIQQGIAWCYL
ncbi:MAG: hypothetical protein R3F28_03275 [Candidatus Kapaibacterium sp.]